MVEDALALVDPMVDFGQFDRDNDGFIDAIDIIHSGYGAESGGSGIWSHRWNLPASWISADNNGAGTKVKVNAYHPEPALFGSTGTGITRIGVITHGTGHFFGLPDLYDTDDSSAGIGSWCMMPNAWGFDNDQLHPPHFSAWCKVFLGWVTPSELSKRGVYGIAQAETSRGIWKIIKNYPANEYLLIENRQPIGLDSRIPQGGLAIWHIDESKPSNAPEGFPGQSGWPANNNHYKVALLQADGTYDLEHNKNPGDSGDLYQGGSRRLGPDTVPNSDAYQSGMVYSTQIEISNFSAAGPLMTFFFGLTPVLFVDRSYVGGNSNGSLAKPFTTVHEAYNAAMDGYTLFVRANIYNEAPFTMAKRLMLGSYEGASTISR
jgi:M6 family metalloprotease-like protein